MGFLWLLRHYRYFEKPEGTDIVTKTIAVTKYTAVAGFCIGTWDNFWLQNHRTFGRKLSTMVYWMIPAVGAGLAFTSIAYISCQIRKKSDEWDFVFGTLAASSVIHGFFRKPVYTYYFTVPAIITAVYTHSVSANKPLPPLEENYVPRTHIKANKMANWSKYDFRYRTLFPKKPSLVDPYADCPLP